MSSSEGISDGVRFRASERADGVNQFPSWLHGTGDFIQNPALDIGEFLHIVGIGGPACLGISAPRSSAAAGCVHENAIEFRLGGQMVFVSPWSQAIVKQLRAASPPLEVRETPLGGVTRPHGAFVLHQIAEVKRFATFACANVPPGLTRSGSADMPDCLGTEILKFELPFVKE